jgi:hypothetical protein
MREEEPEGSTGNRGRNLSGRLLLGGLRGGADEVAAMGRSQVGGWKVEEGRKMPGWYKIEIKRYGRGTL